MEAGLRFCLESQLGGPAGVPRAGAPARTPLSGMAQGAPRGGPGEALSLLAAGCRPESGPLAEETPDLTLFPYKS